VRNLVPQLLILTSILFTTFPQEPGAADPEPEAVVELWFERMNALDGTAQASEALAALYHGDAQHITGPESHQRGTVTFAGRDKILLMAEQWSARYSDPRFRIDVVTAREQSEALYHRAEGPWGGAAVAVTYHAAFTRREDGKRFLVPGAAFFQLHDGGIRRVRFYAADGEMAPVEPMTR